ncbi:hypothetical protein Arub01_23860 [Actinomadura rubrobrunea]|uniref:Lipoprotein n=1 Tax=Actinomadura rubrobrunea TaxID=115335 RepID=A0A9W6UWC9_9ACTN|nr:hypothetical protein [Actinomadura rubrobrunea]GLW64142.1 hypothetical protein Arub01_23860 [Actinomadura rubrobrunea]
MRTRVAAVLIMVMAGAAACGGEDGGAQVASAGGSAAAKASASPSKSLDPDDAMLQFARCMRANGVNVPDPQGGDLKGMRLAVKGVDRDRLQDAMEKCRPYLMAGGRIPDLKDPKVRDQYTEFAQCMRQQGVDIPDPDPDGSFRLPEGKIDRSRLDKAREACRHLLPGARR